MNRRQRIPLQATALAVCVAVQLVISAFAPFGLAICKANDGHVALEMAHDDSQCFADFRRHHPADASDHDLGNHGCTDTKITSGTGTIAAVSSRDLTTSQVPAVAVSSFSVPAVSPVAHLEVRVSDISRPAVAQLRQTTVLLI